MQERQRAVVGVDGQRGQAGVPVDVEALIGAPGTVLVEQARDAALLVVGHPGRGAWAGTPLGSVALRCVLHATVPVTVVRPEERTQRRDLKGEPG